MFGPQRALSKWKLLAISLSLMLSKICQKIMYWQLSQINQSFLENREAVTLGIPRFRYSQNLQQLSFIWPIDLLISSLFRLIKVLHISKLFDSTATQKGFGSRSVFGFSLLISQTIWDRPRVIILKSKESCWPFFKSGCLMLSRICLESDLLRSLTTSIPSRKILTLLLAISTRSISLSMSTSFMLFPILTFLLLCESSSVGS